MLPSIEYAERLENRETRIARCQRLHIRLGNIRLAVVIAGVLLAWISFGRHLISPWWLLSPLAAFVAAAIFHARILRQRTCAERAAKVYRDGLARIEDRWQEEGETGERFQDVHHVYSADLDLFGRGSLFQLLSVARTRMGEDLLAEWLRAPSRKSDLLQRHAAIRELREKLNFREDLLILGEDARVGVHPVPLLKWAESSVPPKNTPMRALALVLVLLFVVSAVVWGLYDFAWATVAVVAVEALLAHRLRHRIEIVVHGAEQAFADIDLLSSILARMEVEPLQSSRLLELQQQLQSDHQRSSQAIAKLRGLVDLVMSRDNLILRVLDIPLMYSVQVVFAVENWQRHHGSAVRRWVNAVAEIEALLSLATYSYEHPEDVFPEFVEGAACFHGDELGHPLIPEAKCVRNSVRLGGQATALLVSGSNMSGKSTLLRAVGIGTVLAMAGCPVRARKLRMTPLQVGASLRIADSLQEGSSRFYAEITRLRGIADLAGAEPPLLFLLDELLQGTNSADRRVGAEGLVKALLARGAIGLLTTHDLALTEITGSLDGHIRNVHFQDEIENGQIRFDYKLRDGVVTKSNGLELMRSIGLEV